MAARFRIVEDDQGEWWFTLIAANNEPVVRSTEGYTRREDAVRGIGDLMGIAQDLISAAGSGTSIVEAEPEPEAEADDHAADEG